MSQELAIMQQKDVEIAGTLSIEINIYRALRYSLFPDKKIPDYAFGLYMAACYAKKYDPLKKPYHIIMMPTPVKDDKGKIMVDKNNEQIWESHPVIMPGIISYRIDAERTNKFMGLSPTEYGPMITKKFVDKEVTFPEWASVNLYKLAPNGEKITIPAKLYWMECYAVAKKGSTVPNDMWAKRSRAQLEKCVHAHAFRIGFSEEIGSVMTFEEMEGRETEAPTEKDITPEQPKLEEAPISMQNPVDETELLKHLDNINNSLSKETLIIAFNDAQRFSKVNKAALNRVCEAKDARKSYLEQSKKPDVTQQERDEWIESYDKEAKV